MVHAGLKSIMQLRTTLKSLIFLPYLTSWNCRCILPQPGCAVLGLHSNAFHTWYKLSNK